MWGSSFSGGLVVYAAEHDRRVKALHSQVPALDGRYDLIYFDTDPGESLAVLDHSERLLRKGGLLISANLFLGQFAPDMPGLETMAEYRLRILDAARWLTAYIPDGTSVSVRV